MNILLPADVSLTVPATLPPVGDSTPLRLRVRLADRAGALAQVATVLGVHGGNILAIDMHKGDGATAIDDLVVDFTVPPSWGDLRADLTQLAAAELIGQTAGEPSDPVVTAIGAAGSLVAGDTATLAAACALVCSAAEVEVTATAGEELSLPIGDTGEFVVLSRAGHEFTPTEGARIEALVEMYLRL